MSDGISTPMSTEVWCWSNASPIYVSVQCRRYNRRDMYSVLSDRVQGQDLSCCEESSGQTHMRQRIGFAACPSGDSAAILRTSGVGLAHFNCAQMSGRNWTCTLTVSKLAPMQYRFLHRWNNDRTIDSVCTVCSKTLCRDATLMQVRQCENAHRCPGPIRVGSIYSIATGTYVN